MRLLQDVLENDYGLDLTGWTLYEAFDITPNGQTILGRGLNPDGVLEAYLVSIPEPATLLLMALTTNLLWNPRMLRGYR